jgi:hypothetical protein
MLMMALLASGIALPATAQRAKPTKTTVTKATPKDQAARLYRERAAAHTALQTLQRDHRQSADQATRLLREAGYPARDVAPALTKDARLSPAKAALVLKDGGYSTADIVQGLQQTQAYSLKQWVAIFRDAQFPALEIGPVLAKDLRTTASEAAQAMKDAGYSVDEVAQMLKDDYGLSAYEAAQALEEAGFSRHAITQALPAVGYAVEPPGLTRYSITEYRPGMGGRLYDDGILDTGRTPQDDNPADVVIEGQGLDDPWLRVAMSSRGTSFEAEIIEQSPTEVTARFDAFHGGSLMVQGTGGTSPQLPAKALAYYWVEPDVLPSFFDGLDVAVGAPVGEGRVSLMGQNQTFSVAPFDQFGLKLDVVDLNSQSVAFDVQPGPDDGQVRLLITVDFEESGRELQGTFIETIPVWTCGSFEIPQSECASLSPPCLANQLGAAFQSALTCTAPDNWREDEQPGPAIPIEGDLTNPSIQIAIDLDGHDDIEAVQTTLSFAGDVSIAGPMGDVPLTLIQGWIEEQVNDQLHEALQDVDLGAELAAVLDGIRTTIGPGIPSRALYPHQGSLFIDMAERY